MASVEDLAGLLREEEMLPSFSCPEFGFDVLADDSMLAVALATSRDGCVSANRLESLGIVAPGVAVVYNGPSWLLDTGAMLVSETS